MKFNSVFNSGEDMFDIHKILKHLESIEAKEQEKKTNKKEKEFKTELDNAVDMLASFRDALLKKGFSNQFAETALLEIIKKGIEKGEF